MRDELPKIIDIEVVNWDKHQPKRNDVKNPTWFKLKHDLLDDPVIYSLSPIEFKIWIYFLTQCSKQNTSSIRVNTGLMQTMYRLRTDHVQSCIFKLEQYQIVRVVSRNAHVTLDKIRIDKIREDVLVSAKPPKEEKQKFDIELLYKNYPKRNGSQNKKTGLKRFEDFIKTAEMYARIEKSIHNYAAWCKENNKTGTELVKQFGNFLSIWEEYEFKEPKKTNFLEEE